MFRPRKTIIRLYILIYENINGSQIICDDTFVCNVKFFFHGVSTPSGPGPPHYRGFTITLRHTTLGWTSLDEWSARHRYLYLTTQNTQKRYPWPGGIRTRNPSKRVAVGPRLRPHGHWDRLCEILYFHNVFIIINSIKTFFTVAKSFYWL
jgi:hypothetical protein